MLQKNFYLRLAQVTSSILLLNIVIYGFLYLNFESFGIILQGEALSDTDISSSTNKPEVTGTIAPISNHALAGLLERIPIEPARPPDALAIPSLDTVNKKFQVPLILNPSPTIDDIEDNLLRGVVRYPGSKQPGEAGVSDIFGHSSLESSKPQIFATVFAHINELKPGDEILVTSDGKQFTYVVQRSAVIGAEELDRPISSDKKILRLITCWPRGTRWRRYVVTAELKI